MDQSSVKPRVLIVATGRWVSTARLAMALRECGCAVEFLGAKEHPARSAAVFERTYQYDPLWPLAELRVALELSAPAVVIPVDELALMHLQELEDEPGVKDLLCRSLGGERVIAAAESRMALLRLASEVEVAAPETIEIEAASDVDAAVARFGLPLVLKGDATSGGRGVRLVRSVREARREWGLLHHPPSLARVIKRGTTAGDWTHLRCWVRRKRSGVTAQRFIPGGKERTGMAVCVRGNLLASACLEVVESWCERGPSSVVRVVEDVSITHAMRRVAAKLGVTGFCGFDFMVDGRSGENLLIEMNPRPTQLVHLSLGPGRDLVAAYARGVLGLKVQDREGSSGECIALFPLALERGRVPAEAFHDVPWECPALVRHALGRVPATITEDTRWHG